MSMLAIKDLRTGELVEKIDGCESWVTMVEGELVIVKYVGRNTTKLVPRGVDYEIVTI